MASTSGSLVTRKYNNFKGLDVREGEISLNRSPDALNLYRNYKSSNLLETRPDIELLVKFDNPIYGLFFYEVNGATQIIVHSGESLYKVIKTKIIRNTSFSDAHIISGDMIFENGVPATQGNKWSWAEGDDYDRLEYFNTFTNPGYLYIIRRAYINGETINQLYSCWKVEADFSTYRTICRFIKNTDDIPSNILSDYDLANYGKRYIDFGHEMTPSTSSSQMGSIPDRILSTYTKTTIKASGMNQQKSNFFVYDGLLYIKDGLNYLTYDGSTVSPVVGYIPTTSISRTPAGGGTTFEDVNLLSDYRINTFVGDGESTEYHLDTPSFDEATPVVKVNGVTKTYPTDFTYDKTNGTITFTAPPPIPDTDGQDNVEIKYKKTITGYADRIKKCTLACLFDNRIFFSGNPDYPNVVWHSSLDDPTYVSDLDYYNEGLDLTPVKSMVAGNNALWVFKEPSQANTTIFYHVPTIDSQYGKIYPNSHSGISTGCISTGVNFNDDICFFSTRGLEGISGSITTENVVGHRSSFIDNKLLSEINYKNVIVEEWEGYLMCFIDHKVFLADSRQVNNLNDSYEYDWYYWELENKENLPVFITSAYVKNDVLYLGGNDIHADTEGYRLYSLTGHDEGVESYWTTPLDTFGYGNYQKITNKRGCVIECEGEEVNVSVKTNKDTMTLIKTYENVTDYITARIKRKKFKDIQIKISSNKNMKLESIMLESYIGAYIKR